MRQIHVLVGRERADRVVQLAAEHEGVAVSSLDARGGEGNLKTVVFLTVPNARLGDFIERAAKEVEDVEFVFSPSGDLSLRTPLGDVHEKVRNVQILSPLELLLGSLQSLGGWSGLLIYSTLSGVIAAYALIFNLAYLLVAAMLIAPIGAPAMVAVVGCALGDRKMIGRGTLRFLIALLVLALAAVGLGFAYDLNVSTPTMELVSSLSLWTVVIAIAGGAAGASAQIRSDRDSLVTGTATGFLVAVALSPPTAVLGLAIAIPRFDYVAQMAFNLTLTYFGIILGGALTLSMHGVQPRITGVDRGSGWIRTTALAAAALALVLMVAWQSMQGPSFRKSDLTYETVEAVRRELQPRDDVILIDTQARFTRGDLPMVDTESIYLQIVVEPVGISDEQARESVRGAVAARLERELPQIVPYIDVTALTRPTSR